jgi:hypothetical protein
MKPVFSFVLLLLFVSITLLFGGSCANIIPPQGGPRDSIPPQLLNATPPDSTLNFRGDKITFTFDEYIGDLQDVQNNLLFTPLFTNNPRVDVKGKTVTVNFRDTLEPNTTYILKFGDAIKDYNEGNVLRNFVYTFSTGPALDSLELKGKVILAQTGKVDSNIVVVLHRNLKDSAVMNQRPQYVTKLDANGNFRFRNLPAATFAVYAIGDAGISRRYQNKTQLFAFLDSPVTVGAVDTSLLLYAYKEAAATAPPGPAARPAAQENRLTFTTNLTNNQQDLNKDLVISFATPLRTFDSGKLLLSTDSIFTPATYKAALDSTRKELRLQTAWKEATRYNLVMDRDFATDTSGRRLLKSDTLFFTTSAASDYGKISIRLRNIDLTQNPVLLFVQNEQVVFSAPVPSGNFDHNRFAPGDYELRILYDTNGNGKWDPGQFFGVKKQPELVKPIEQKITVKAAWDNEYERSL